MILAGLMIARNEAGKFLERCIVRSLEFCDILYILDDHSTDNSYEIYAKYPRIKVFTSDTRWEDGENLLRAEINERAIVDCNPDWCLGIDADDFHISTREQMEELMNQSEYDWFGFAWYDMWNSEKYYRLPVGVAPRMYRVGCVDDFDYGTKKYHIFQVPNNIMSRSGKYTDLKIKHLGYVRKTDRDARYNLGQKLDPDRIYYSEEEYQKYTVSDNQELIEWVDE